MSGGHPGYTVNAYMCTDESTQHRPERPALPHTFCLGAGLCTFMTWGSDGAWDSGTARRRS